jgi:hypothetical protein
METSLQVNHTNVAVLEPFMHTTILFYSNSYAFGSIEPKCYAQQSWAGKQRAVYFVL